MADSCDRSAWTAVRMAVGLGGGEALAPGLGARGPPTGTEGTPVTGVLGVVVVVGLPRVVVVVRGGFVVELVEVVVVGGRGTVVVVVAVLLVRDVSAVVARPAVAGPPVVGALPHAGVPEAIHRATLTPAALTTTAARRAERNMTSTFW